ncbi:uncharacterized protein LOC111811897 isoform X3 [Cucurbita pepo subsp. pepo]|uniref:uncharacterized protein LOC111811897 isoform X3 n=1 Tax=Cucurbita pepo subsp. pepo TaxID=3664 RepID=UPI000C9D5E66|nr:uncharacterized protein LOC111811897 isoform X3 [Cucurbita pepo subsp. pepo]
MGHVTASSGSSINGPPSRAPSSLSSTAFTNFPLISALISFAVAQFIKFFTSWYKERRWDFKRLIGSGGMPSSHSSTVSALAVAIGLQEGFGASVFAVALILACNVRCNWCEITCWTPSRGYMLLCSIPVTACPTRPQLKDIVLFWLLLLGSPQYF